MAKTVKGRVKGEAALVEIEKPPLIEALDTWEVWAGLKGRWKGPQSFNTRPEAEKYQATCDWATALVHITIPAIK